jgi:hypothetical protein
MHSEYKLFERLLKFVGKKVIATQKLNAYFLRMHAKITFFELLFTVLCI